jgi:ubiquinone/menaquinone biosynthesis C-methylase UbiE
MEPDYLIPIAAAFVRGKLNVEGSDEELIRKGREQALKIHRFKRSQLPRVLKCIGLIKGIRPATQLDIGPGRGAFLWTMITEIPYVQVTCVDVLAHRVDLINTVRKGGIERVQCYQRDVHELEFTDDRFDVVTALEVLEHLPNPARAVRELCRVGKDWLLVSVPSKPDNNPEHINLFSADELQKLLIDNGAKSVQMHHVLNHRIALARIDAADS